MATHARSIARARAQDTFPETVLLHRRAAFGSLAAAGALLLAPRVAKAASLDDADVFEAIAKVKALRAEDIAAGDRLSALERQLPSRASFPALCVKAGDGVIFRTDAAEGTALERETIKKARSTRAVMKAVLRDAEDHPLYGPAFARVNEACEADEAWDEFRDAEIERLGIDEAQATLDEAASATSEAAHALLDLKPQTVAGLRAILITLEGVRFFDIQQDSEEIVRFLLDAPALALGA